MKGSQQEVARKEHIESTESKRVQSVDPFGGVVTEGNFTTRTEVAKVGNVTTIYKGMAQIGTAVTDARWQIKKTIVDETTGTVVSVTWADSTDEFIKVWNDRATYTYA